MTNTISFKPVKNLLIENKDKVKADASGAYPTILSAFGSRSEDGEFYHITNHVKRLFDPGTYIRRKIDGRYCRAEEGHPDVSGMDRNKAINRLKIAASERVCAQIVSATLKPYKNDKGENMLVALGRVIPKGPFGGYLKESLEDPEENVAWSARSFLNPCVKNGVEGIEIKSILGWDRVEIPNVPVANKMDTQFALDSILFREEDFNASLGSIGDGIKVDDAIKDYTMLKTEFGWQKVEKITPARTFLEWS